jgi:ubiquitin C-terminal hydrolase
MLYIKIIGYFNSMSQCFQATVPLVDYFIKLNDDDYVNSEYIRTFKAFTEKYHKSSGSINPSSVLSIISSQKKHFGNYSQQDSYDAFLTMLETLIREQKKVLKKKEGIKEELNKILDSRVPVGEIFSFSLMSRGNSYSHLIVICRSKGHIDWVNDPSLAVYAPLSVIQSLVE